MPIGSTKDAAARLRRDHTRRRRGSAHSENAKLQHSALSAETRSNHPGIPEPNGGGVVVLSIRMR
jgi:hypothetical protein